MKKGYTLEKPILDNANISRIINSDNIQSVIKPGKKNTILHHRQNKNPLTKKTYINFLNSYSKERRAASAKKEKKYVKNKEPRRKQKLAKKNNSERIDEDSFLNITQN